MIIAYSRVSSKEQDKEKYRTFFNRYENTMNIKFNDIILEQVSASKTKLEDRNLWNYITNPNIKKIVVTEISRIGRNTRDGVKLLKHITNQREDLEIYVVMSNLTIKSNMSAEEEFIFDLQLSLAKREVKLLGERTKLGIQRARESGKHIGRPFGSTKITKEKELQIKALLALGEKKSEIARVTNISRTTLYNYLSDKG
ncbi:recombinase family protein (plasmid) [Thiospirochaeta perfilievii]|uniref:Recombinase family protein n=1 Tax=Thiospirochaeta perfilievii TaxID=252967 RepID=A0A5C1QH62_9SPIO|nr:recombinase family protein [Thiospirochaeta perfilievii]QEN06429.1 recombinase family protein [Thiospirochaeta perfilievii]